MMQTAEACSSDVMVITMATHTRVFILPLSNFVLLPIRIARAHNKAQLDRKKAHYALNIIVHVEQKLSW